MCQSIRQRMLTGGLTLKLPTIRAGLNVVGNNIQNSILSNKPDGPHIKLILYKQEILPTSGL
jgi:hypothetical protein